MVKLLIKLYLDPGTGSLLIQFIIASILGISLFFKQLKIRLKETFNKVFRKKL
jgi:hypothetical protein